jgi:hypothetical protein
VASTLATWALMDFINTKVINSLSLIICERRSVEAIPSKNEIAAPFGLAMTCKEI